MLALRTACVDSESTQQVRLIMFTPASSPSDGANCQLLIALHCRTVSGVVDCFWAKRVSKWHTHELHCAMCAVCLADSAGCEHVVLLYLSCLVSATCCMHISAVRVCFVCGASFHSSYLLPAWPRLGLAVWSITCTCCFWRCAAVCAHGNCPAVRDVPQQQQQARLCALCSADVPSVLAYLCLLRRFCCCGLVCLGFRGVWGVAGCFFVIFRRCACIPSGAYSTGTTCVLLFMLVAAVVPMQHCVVADQQLYHQS
jgi:hypothetical protein